MVWQEAEQCDGQDGVDDPHSLLSCFGADHGNAFGCQRVAHQDDNRGHQGAKNQTDYTVSPQSVVPLSGSEVFKTAVVIPSLQWTHEDEDQYSHSTKTPQSHTYQQRPFWVPHSQVGVWMHRGHVAVHADAGHEADAHVDVGIVQNPSELTGEVSKLPFVLMEVVVDPQGQHAEDHDVRRGQVADVDTESRSRADPDGEDIQRHEISWKAYN